MEGTPNDKVNVADLFGQKKGILFGVPGAFTPGCTKVTMATYGLMQAWWMQWGQDKMAAILQTTFSSFDWSFYKFVPEGPVNK